MSELVSGAKARKFNHSPGALLPPKDHSNVTPSAAAAKGRSDGLRKNVFTGLGVGVFLLASYFGYQKYRYVGTDNATVEAHATLLSSQVKGVIVRADVEENQKVKAGQVIVEINPNDYQNALDQKEANAASLAAQAKGAQQTYQRTLSLYNKGAATEERLDMAEATYQSLESQLKGAQAEAAEAKLNLSYTQILAPADGTVGRKSFDVGMFASPGQPLLGFVSSDERWVVANLKETDMEGVSEGEKAYVTVDSSGHTYEGLVDSISPATGATFTLLPPDNATGNFTKVVQRVSVRIKLPNLSPDDIDHLQNGLSAEVKIRIR
jgi:membrane fusion protein (multidrug efflux system)